MAAATARSRCAPTTTGCSSRATFWRSQWSPALSNRSPNETDSSGLRREGPERHPSMIIEMFGPAGCGKTTLSEALAQALSAEGHAVSLVASSRPAEQAARAHLGADRRVADGGLSAALKRAAKVVDVLPVLMRRGEEGDIADRLMQLFPPYSVVWSLRYRRYLNRLCHSWRAARNGKIIVIFDQGFLSALCSLILLAPPSDRTLVAHALDLLPQPDLLVRVNAPEEVLESRLRARLRDQGTLERLFELNLRTNLAQVEIAAQLDSLLVERGREAINVHSLDRQTQMLAVDRLLRESRALAWEPS
ncbi:MAG: hypothetical protein EOR02_32905 [Mesorhizobium sp.]|nr:MAG: hypothetical protein EOR02_32905 [Mesorhizobium sp.]